ncbi:MAG: hypothetical protein D8M58_15395 [Calditrichaeota bacterium]|nr:MAG: hypothetical protein DWQ03_07125 [Calditrichota bacterium]MBL1206788.1 hypothetical protein [Calditrichota bacterium]NOG46616.1 hypothetical protein [Calditrichota bacterium]
MNKFLLFFLILYVGCQPSLKDEQPATIESIAKVKYGTDIFYLSNKKKTYTICYSQKEKTALNPFPALKFFVYNNENAEVLFEDNLTNGSIKWVGKYTFKVESVARVVSIDQENQSITYIYDVKLKKKTK